jgi:hypothetical protein
MFRVTVVEVNPLADLGAPPVEMELFKQTVPELDMRALAALINQRPRKPRAPNAVKKEAK